MNNSRINSLLGEVLLSEYGVMTCVLKHLSNKDLHQAACVCKTFNKVARRLMKERCGLSFGIWSLRDVRETNKKESSNRESDEREDEVMPGQLTEQLKCFVREARFFPSFAVVILSDEMMNNDSVRQAVLDNLNRTTFEENMVTTRRKRRKISKNLEEFNEMTQKISGEFEGKEVIVFIRKCLPPNCKLVCLSTSGVIGTRCDFGNIIENEDPTPSIAALLQNFPEISFEVVSLRNIEKPHSPEYAECKKLLQNSRLKAFLPFFAWNQHFKEMLSLKKLIALSEGKFAMGGGIVEHSIIMESVDSTEVVPGLALGICGDNVTAASTVLAMCGEWEQHIEKKMRELADTGIVSGNDRSFAFLIIAQCIGQRRYIRKHVESSMFRRHFPSTPVIGLFVTGELGSDFNPMIQNDESEQAMSDYDPMLLSSVLVVCAVRSS